MSEMRQERMVKVDTRRLDILMAAAGYKTDSAFAEAIGIDVRTLLNVRKLQKCSWDVWNGMADKLNCNPIDLLITPGYPDPKWAALAALSN